METGSSAETRKRVVLCDDHPVFRAGLRALLQKERDILLVGEASSAREALELVRHLGPDVLVLDIEMEGSSGMEVAEQLFHQPTSTRILVLSAHDDEHYVRELVALGVSGFLTKEEVGEKVVEAIRAVAEGKEGWMSRRVAVRMMSLQRFEQSEKRLLSRREVEILQYVARGRVNKEIASGLSLSSCTVKNHLANIFEKLGVHSRVEAVLAAQRLGYLPVGKG
ncbi:MAG: response regulator transcription factor [Acidobacteria bacterium]|nr:response regulator transcription factor [Acidobacteriota bacterium]